MEKLKNLIDRIIGTIDANSLGHLFLNDLAFRGFASIYQGIVFNTIYGLFRGITAVAYRSVWFAAIGIYFLCLSGIRLSLAHHVRWRQRIDDTVAQDLFEYHGCLICGLLMLVLNAAMSAMTVWMIRDNLSFRYPGYIIFFSAAYTLYIAVMAIINIVRFQKLRTPLLLCSQSLTFMGALMSVMAFQTALIARFGGADALFRAVTNAVTGAVVCAVSLVISAYTIIDAMRNIKSLEATGQRHQKQK